MKLTRAYKIGVIAILIFVSLLMVGPFIWMFITSLKTYDETIQTPMLWFPEKAQWINFSLVADKYPFFTLYLNTLIVALGTVVSQLLFASMAAYAFARLNFPFKNTIFLGMLALLMVPSQIFLISQFNIMVKLNLTNTIEALIILICLQFLACSCFGNSLQQFRWNWKMRQELMAPAHSESIGRS